MRTGNAQLSPSSPTIVCSRPLPIDSCSNTLHTNDIAYKSTDVNKISKIQLPDLVKESSILKSKTAPNIYNASSAIDKELIEIRVHSQRTTSNILKDNVEHMKISHNTEGSNDFRPCSPLHETSIIVPQVIWNKKDDNKDISSVDSEIDSDSLSSSNSNETAENDQLIPVNLLPPRLQIHSTDGDLLLDEEADRYKDYDPNDGQTFEPDSIEICSLRGRQSHDKHTPVTNSPVDNMHPIETVNNNMQMLELQENNKKSSCSSPISVTSTLSNKQDNSEENDVTTTVFTETEFSEWARNGDTLVSDDLRDVELDIDSSFVTTRKNNISFSKKLPNMLVEIAKDKNKELDFSKVDQTIDGEYPSNNTSKLLANSDDIGYMDTDNESLLDDSLQDTLNVSMPRNRGYIEFVNIRTTDISNSDIQINSPVANAPIARLDLENDSYDEEIEQEALKDANVIEIDPITMEDVIDKLNRTSNKSSPMKTQSIAENQEEFNDEIKEQSLAEAVNKELLQSMEADSLLVLEPTEDTTTSDVVTILTSPQSIILENMKDKHEELTKADSINPNYIQCVKRLQFRIVEVSNAKDSIDVRKSKRKNSKTVIQTHTTDMIAEEVRCQDTIATNGSGIKSPATSRKLEEIIRERSKQKNLIQDLLMDKFEAHKQKSAEKKARRAAKASSFTTLLSPLKLVSSNMLSPNNGFTSTSITSPIPSSDLTYTTFSGTSKSLMIGDSSRSLYSSENSDQIAIKTKISNMPGKIDESTKLGNVPSSTTSRENIFRTPTIPPRSTNEEIRKTAERAKQDARERARLKSDEDLGLSPEDKIKQLRLKITRKQLSMDDTEKNNISEFGKARSCSFNVVNSSGLKLQTSKSTDNMKNIAKNINFNKLPMASTKSMDELLNTASSSILDNNSIIVKRDKKKSKDPERRKSIIQAVSDFFFKKETSPLSNQKDKLSMFRLTSKSKGKVSIHIIIILLLLILS